MSFRVRFHTNRDQIDVVTPENPVSDAACLVLIHEGRKSFTVYPWHLITTPIVVDAIKEIP